jgi:methylated-DNA-[protein]-cysteine S-methyltransferase
VLKRAEEQGAAGERVPAILPNMLQWNRRLACLEVRGRENVVTAWHCDRASEQAWLERDHQRAKGGKKGMGTAPLKTGLCAETPLGTLWLAASENGLVALAARCGREQFEAMLRRRYHRPIETDGELLRVAAEQICEYLAGRRREFDLPVDWSVMRPFQRAVLQATCTIPYGQTRTYGELAAAIGRAGAARAVGRAEARNPLPLIIPCHRVIGRDGKLHGYGMADGLKTKEWLLKLEGVLIA